MTTIKKLEEMQSMTYEEACKIISECVIVKKEYLTSLQTHIAELEKEVETDNWLIMERQRLLDVIPECEAHGKCVPHAIEWINEQKRKS